VTPASTPARERGRGGGNAGTGRRRLHDERRSQRIVKIARDRHRARRQARRRPGGPDPTRSAQSTLSASRGREEPLGRPDGALSMLLDPDSADAQESPGRKPGLPLASTTALRFSSAEDAAEGPSEADSPATQRCSQDLEAERDAAPTPVSSPPIASRVLRRRGRRALTGSASGSGASNA
jgi:hypothetical protein